MDTITHALSGALFAHATGSKTAYKGLSSRLSTRARILAGFAAAAFPDIDILTRLFGSMTYLNQHRGITHSLLMAPIWAWFLAVIFMWLSRQRYAWRDFYAISLLGILAHIGGDLITAYGTMVLAPFSMQKFSYPSTFILDAYFTGIIILALLGSVIWKGYSRHITRIGSLVLISYIAFQGTQYWQAHEIAKSYSKQQKLTDTRIHVFPQPLSPFNWKLMIEQPEQYLVSYVNLRRIQQTHVPASAGFFARVDAQYQPLDKLNWLSIKRFGSVEEASLAKLSWQHLLPDIKRFMEYPGLVNVEQSAEENCAWFIDQRFVMEGLRAPFLFGACLNKIDQEWTSYRRTEDARIAIQ